MQASFVRNAVVLGLLTAIGPFAVDMYLPSLPSVATSFGSDADGALFSMTAFFLTFALGQLIYGPSSDLLGRRRPLVAGIVIFVVTVVSSFAFSSFLVYLASSPFVLSHQYGQSSLEYSLAFSVNAIAFFAAMQLTARLAQRFGLARLIRPAVLGFAAILLVTLGLAAAGIDQFPVVAVGLFLSYGCLGVIQPVASVLALDAHGEIAGTAASLMSALQLATGSIMVAVSGQIGDGSIVRLLVAIAGCAVIAALAQLTLGRVRPGHAPVMPATFEIG